MNQLPLIECVPNFSEGRDLTIIKQITDQIESVEGVQLLDVDPGIATNRTVVTFVGSPKPVIRAAFLAIKTASELIDMSKHTGEHPRMGATDVCPLVPVSGVTMEEVVQYAHELGHLVGQELDIPLFMYESAASKPERKNLATIRAGEYEGMAEKLKQPEWKPDYGPARFNPRAGVTAIGARDFLIAYNVNLNTTSVRRANSVAFDVREQGRLKRKGDPIIGEIEKDNNGDPLRIPGKCKAVKGIGWFIEEYGIAQISMNLTDINVSPLHVVFEACRESANERGLRVTGSELVGLIPLRVMLDTGRYFLKKQRRSAGISESEIINIAVKSLGLDELSSFDPEKKIIEYRLRNKSTERLAGLTLTSFSDLTASESPAPGGGSISAYVGTLAAALGTMVANLSAHKRGWDDRWEYFSEWAEKGQQIQQRLLRLVDEDTQAFNAIITAIRLPKKSEEEKSARKKAIDAATVQAIEVPLNIMRTTAAIFDLLEAMIEKGNPNSLSDAGVGILCAQTAIKGAHFNVLINSKDLNDKSYLEEVIKESDNIETESSARSKKLLEVLEKMLRN